MAFNVAMFASGIAPYQLQTFLDCLNFGGVSKNGRPVGYKLDSTSNISLRQKVQDQLVEAAEVEQEEQVQQLLATTDQAVHCQIDACYPVRHI